MSRILGVLMMFFVLHASANKTQTPEWHQKMRELSETLKEVYPLLLSSKRFNDKKNAPKIEAGFKKLSALGHVINSATLSQMPQAARANDPTIEILSDLFKSETDRAYREYKAGRKEFARTILRPVTSYCIACHTRSDTGPKFSNLLASPEIKTMDRLSRAEMLAAIRDYDQALQEFESIVRDRSIARAAPFDWETAIHYALALAVRVQKDPDRTQKIIENVLATSEAPVFVKESAEAWKESVKVWKEEVSRTLSTQDGRLAEAKRLLARAQSSQKYPNDESGEIDYLRASAVAHDLMANKVEGTMLSETLLITGTAYEALGDLRIWSLHELYYESCIRSAPKSTESKACYASLERSIYAGYSGSGGTFLPRDVLQKLTELKKLAGVSQ